MISTMSVWLTIMIKSRWALMIYKWTSSTNFLMWSNIEVISTHWESIHFSSVSSTSSFVHHMWFHIPFSIKISVSSWTSSSSVSIIRSIIIFDIVSELFFVIMILSVPLIIIFFRFVLFIFRTIPTLTAFFFLHCIIWIINILVFFTLVSSTFLLLFVINFGVFLSSIFRLWWLIADMIFIYINIFTIFNQSCFHFCDSSFCLNILHFFNLWLFNGFNDIWLNMVNLMQVPNSSFNKFYEYKSLHNSITSSTDFQCIEIEFIKDSECIS